VSPPDDLVGKAAPRAAEQARAAADAMGVTVTVLSDLDDLRAAAELLKLVWGERAPVSTDLLRALEHTGSYVAGAFLGTELIGASVAFLADGGAKLHSHITGLLPGSQRKGIGLALKLHQRAWALAHGIGVVSWTFDPLVRRNGYFNLTKLGGVADRFHLNFYGEIADLMNQGDETDRCEVAWDLTSGRVDAAADGGAAEHELVGLQARRAVVLLEEGAGGSPLVHGPSGDLRLCWVPEDVVALRSTAPTLAHEWRLALRETLGASLTEGFVATAVTRTGWYVLERSS
jgi:predicted GNAT superfamily acetyltransferase